MAVGVLALGFGGGSKASQLGADIFSNELAAGDVQDLGDAGGGSNGAGSKGAGSEALVLVSNLDGLSARRDRIQAQLGSDTAAHGESAANADVSSTPTPRSMGPNDLSGVDDEAMEGHGLSSRAADLWRPGLREEGSYRAGVPHGLWRSWREDGSLRSQGDYVHGFRNGVWVAFGESGALLSELTFDEGARSGAWTAYAESGAVLEEGQYTDDAPSGRWTTYYSGGQVKERGLFVNGLREGVWEFYDDLGQPTLQAGEYRAGIKIQ